LSLSSVDMAGSGAKVKTVQVEVSSNPRGA